MARQPFLLVRSDGQLEKSKSFDKMDTGQSSYFACVDPVLGAFSFLGGSAYIGQSYNVIPDTTVTMSTSGNYQTTGISANYWNVGVFSISPNPSGDLTNPGSGTLVMSEGTAASTQNAVIIPTVPFGNIPVAKVFFQDNGSSGAGTIRTILAANLVDIRPFFAGQYGTPDPSLAPFQVIQQFPASRNLNVVAGSMYFSSGTFVQFNGTTLQFGTGGSQQTPAIASHYYNKALIGLDSLNTCQVYFGTAASTAGAVVLPVTPQDILPLSIVTFQDNGSAGIGTILNITQANIQDVRPIFQNLYGQLRATALDNLRVISQHVPNKQVVIQPGNLYPTPDSLVQVASTTVDFGTGPNQLTALPVGYFQRIALLLGSTGNVIIVQNITGSGAGAWVASYGSVTNPVITQVTTPIAFIDIHDDGTGMAGSILPITQSNITDIRPWLGSAVTASPAQTQTETAGQTFTITIPQAVYVSQGDGGRTVGDVYPLDASNNSRYPFYGFAITSATTGNPITVQNGGMLQGFSGLTSGEIYYADPSTPGGITNVKPSTLGYWIVPVGTAVGTTGLFINPALAATAYQQGLSFTAGQTMSSAGTVVYLSAGSIYKADATDSTKVGIVGVTAAPVTSSNSVQVLTSGVLGGLSALTAGALYYVDPTTPGAITASIPTTPGQWVIPVGTALSTTTLEINSALAATAYQVGSTLSVTAGESLVAFRAVYISQGGEGGRTAGDAYRVDPANAARVDFFGFTFASISSSATGLVVTQGILNGFSSLTKGLIYYVDPSNVGQITSSIPTTPGQWVIPVGVAASTTALEIDGTMASQAYVVSATSGGGLPAPFIPADGYQMGWLETLDVSPVDANSTLDSTLTTGVYTLPMIQMSCDKSRTVTTTGTAYTLSGNPNFTVTAGCIIWSGGTWRKIQTVSTQSTGILQTAFSPDLATAACMVSQAVWTQDLTVIGSSGQATRPIDFFPSTDVIQINVDYEDSLTIADAVPDYNSTPNVVVSACNSGAQAAGGTPNDNLFTATFARSVGANQESDYILATNSPQQRLFLVFFPNPSNGSVTAQANLLQYQCSFYTQPTVLTNGGVLNSAFCMTDNSTTPVNCTIGTAVESFVLTASTHNGTTQLDGIGSTAGVEVGMVVTGTGINGSPTTVTGVPSGTQVNLSLPCTASASVPITFSKTVTEVVLTFDFAQGVNTGTVDGDIQVKAGGFVYPRYVQGSTPITTGYWKEVPGSTRKVHFHTNLSSITEVIQISRIQGVNDGNSANTQAIGALREAVVSSVASDIAIGRATHSTISSAITAVTSVGGKIVVLAGTYVENLTVPADVYIEGKGHKTVVNGTITFTSTYALVRCLKSNSVTFNGGTDGNRMTDCWVSSGSTVTNSGGAGNHWDISGE